MIAKKKPQLFLWLFYLMAFVSFVIFLQFTSEYHFYYIEQNYLFRYSVNYFTSITAAPGGYALFSSIFLLQFFGIKYMGAIIMAFLLTIILFFTAQISKKISGNNVSIILCLLPVVLLMFAQFDEYYKLQGTVAFLFAVVAIYCYTFINKLPNRMFYLIITIPILYVLVGSVFSLFAITIIVYELLLKKEKKWVICMTTLILTALTAVITVNFGLSANYKFALLPDFYYNPLLKPLIPMLLYAWLSFIFCIFIGRLLILIKKEFPTTFGKTIIAFSVQLIIIITVVFVTNKKLYDPDRENYIRFDYYSYTSQWDKVIELYNQTERNNSLYLNILNIALAEKGILADVMFEYEQNGFSSVLVNNQMPKLYTDIFYTMGDIASSQRFAFESYVTYDEMISARMLKRLIETNLIFGAYSVAEKYISILEQSLMYKAWATDYKKFLYNDQAIENDPVLGSKRRGLPKEEIEFYATGITDILEKIAIANPSNQTAIQFLGAIYLLNKDIAGFGEIIKKYYGTNVIPLLPKSFNEALALLIDDNVDEYGDYEIPQAIQSKFNELKSTIIENQKNPYLETLIKNQNGDTYWYYYLFNKSS